MRPLQIPQSTPIDQCITCTVLIHNISPDRVTTTLEWNKLPSINTIIIACKLKPIKKHFLRPYRDCYM